MKNRNLATGLLVSSTLVLVLSFNNCTSSMQSGTSGTASDLETSTLKIAGIQPVRPANASLNSTDDEVFAARRILVKARVGVSEEDLANELSAHGGKSLRKITGIDVHVVELPERANEKAIAALLAHNPKFEFAEVDRIVPPNGTVNDPLFPNQWETRIVQAPLAWDTATGASQTIAILDTGVDGNHVDLAAHLVAGWNTFDNNSDSRDVQGHGTAVAGTAAAIGNNSVGSVGVAYDAKIMPIRISALDGWASWSDMAEGVTWAADRGARIVNISYDQLPCSGTIQSSSNYLNGKGGVLVVAAGNSSIDLGCADSSMVVVSATMSDDSLASFTNRGAAIDVAAPGNGVTTTMNGGGYGSWWGTSFSSPMVAGVVALIIDANQSLSVPQIIEVLRQSADDLGAPGFDIGYGYGRVNAARAVALARATTPIANDTQAPSVSIASPTAGSKVSGVISVGVSAADNVKVTRVDLYVGGTFLGSDSVAPFEFNVDTSARADGALALQARAADAAGNLGSSSTVNVTVDNVPDPVDAQAPVVTIISPTNGSTIGGGKGASSNLSISASATDDIAVTGMRIFVDGVLKASSTSGSISLSLSTRKMSSGTHTIRVEASDASGKVSAASVQVTK